MRPSVFRPLFRSNFHGVGEKGDDVVPTAFFNGLDFTDKSTYTGGPTVVADHEGVLNAGVLGMPSIAGARYLGSGVYSDLKADGSPIVPRTQQRTRTGNADFSAFTLGTTFKRYSIADLATLPGWLCEPSRTNRCTCRKVNPTDTTGLTASNSGVLSVVTGQEALLAAAGLGQICTSGAVYRLDNLDNATDSRVSFTGEATTTNAHSMSLYAMAVAGTANLRYNLNSKTDELFPSDRLGKLSWENVVTVVGNTIELQCSANSDVYFIMPQLEEGVWSTSSMYNTNDALGSATRAATAASFPTEGKIRNNNMAFRAIVKFGGSNVNVGRIFGMSTDSSNYLRITATKATQYFSKSVNGTSADTSVTLPPVNKDAMVEYIAVMSSNVGMQLAAKLAASSPWINSPIISTSVAKANVPVSSVYCLGCFNNLEHFSGNILLFDTLLIPAGITDPLAWAKQKWGLPA